MAKRQPGRIVWGWFALAVISGLLPAYLATVTVGSCRDSADPALSVCESGPALGPVGTTVVWVIWAVFALACVYRAFRPLRRGRVRPSVATRASDGSTPRIGAHATVEIPMPGRGGVQLTYAPSRNGRPDAGEVVWAWVPFQEDPTRGKDRPLLIIAPHDAQHVLAMKLTSRPHDRDGGYVSVGAGPWDRQGRESWIDIDQFYRVHRSGIRREAAPVSRATFDRVAKVLSSRYGWNRDV